MVTGEPLPVENSVGDKVTGAVNGPGGFVMRAERVGSDTMRNIRQNLFFAFPNNALGIPVASRELYPFFGLLLSPITAGAAMSLSSVSVIGNALRLRKMKLQSK